MSSDGLLAELERQRTAWEGRPLVRELYTEWLERIRAELSAVEGPTYELGAGIGTFKDFHPSTIATDVAKSRWAAEVVDAQHLPWEKGSVANLVGVDVLHHVPKPERCLAEAERVLAPGGRLVLCEPYASPVSGFAYRRLHHEHFDASVDPFGPGDHSSDLPLEANGALPTLIFWHRLGEFERRYHGLRVVRRERFALLLYPLSGGFTRSPLLPKALVPALRLMERALTPLAPLLAYRCLVVVERKR